MTALVPAGETRRYAATTPLESDPVTRRNALPPSLPVAPAPAHELMPFAAVWISLHPWKTALGASVISSLLALMFAINLPWYLALGAPFLYRFYAEDRNQEDNRRHEWVAESMRKANLAWHQHALERWMASRPLVLVASSPDPLAAMGSFFDKRRAFYVGIDPNTKDLVAVARDNSILVLGVTRSGKTTCIAITALLVHHGPAVVVSTKFDIADDSLTARMKLGHVWVFDPSGEIPSSDLADGVSWLRWSPLEAARSWDRALLTAEVLIGATPVGAEQPGKDNVHWRITAEKFLAPLLFAVALHQNCNITDVRRWVNLSDFATPMSILNAIADDVFHPMRVGARLAIENLVAVMGYDERQRSSVISTTQTVTQAYNFESVLSSCVDTNFDPHHFVRSCDTVYILASSTRQSAVAPIIAAFITAVQEATYQYNRDVPFMDSDRASTLLLLDEAAHVAPVKDLPRFITEGGSQGFQVVALLQSITQAESSWPIQARAFQDYFAVKVTIGGQSDEKTLKAMSALAGEYMRPYVSTSESHTAGFSESLSESHTTSGSQSSTSAGSTYGRSYSSTGGQSVSYRKERRLSEADIASLKPGSALVMALEGWQIVDLVGIRSPAWRAAAGPHQPVLHPRRVELGREVQPPILPPVAELLDAAQRRIKSNADPDGA